MELSPGTRLGSYEILSLLGAGGMGQVYRARDTRLSRDIALKILPEDFAVDPERRQRFEQEARAASSLNHPSIVHVYDLGFSDSLHYIAMELVEGKSLRDSLPMSPLPTRKLLDIAVEIADGLAKAHAAGIVHRDLKPENLIVSAEGHVKIVDFGLAKLSPGVSGDPAEESTSPKLTRVGMVLGTLSYMSPEQASGRAVDFRSDQFSLGAILYEMASGKRAFHKATGPETLTAILREAPEPLASLNPLLPTPLRWIVEERCLAKDPEDRYASTRDLLSELKSVRDHLADTSAHPITSDGGPSRNRWLVGGLTLAAGMLLAGPAAYLGAKASSKIPQPTFREITFNRGTIRSARFAPDGESVVYGAAWDGRPFEPFLARLGSPEVRTLGLPGGDILSISRTGEMAVSLDVHYIGGWQFAGTLARVALAGGAPRPIQEEVQCADWGPNGQDLAIVRTVGGKTRLEYPIGTVLYETAGWISDPRVSPDGKLVAFLDHPLSHDNNGAAAVVDRSGKMKILGRRFAASEGLAWSAGGQEIWFTAAEVGNAFAILGVTPEGAERKIMEAPGAVVLRDISPQGNVLIGQATWRNTILGLYAGSEKERDLSALDWSIPMDLSPDGRTLLISEQGQGVSAAYGVYLRQTSTGSPPVLLGEGQAMALSPDGRWALAILGSQQDRLFLLPTGAGKTRQLPSTGLEYQGWGAFLPDGQHIVSSANEPGHGIRLYVQQLDEGSPRAFTPEGVSLPFAFQALSPDGRYVATLDPSGTITLYPVDGGQARSVPGTLKGEFPVRFAADELSIYVTKPGEIPARIFKVDLSNGKRTLWKEFTPSDPAGLPYGLRNILLTPDGRSYVYSFRRILHGLFVGQGLR